MPRSLVRFIVVVAACGTFSCNNLMSSPDGPIAIQPLEEVDATGLEGLRKALEDEYSRQVVVLEALALPAAAINREKGLRYSTDSLLQFLETHQPDSIACTVGITEADIFTTKRNRDGSIKTPASKYAVFGIFGLARRPGRVCVLSRYRLQRGATNLLLQERVRRVAIHEVGHTRGLKHCADTTCVMTSAVEKLNTIDRTNGKFCERCREMVGG